MSARDHNAYSRGVKAEHQLIQRLRKTGFNVNRSSRDEDIHMDIDCYLEGVSTSIKVQHAALRTGNLAFEIEVFSSRTRKWESSWYFDGRAEQYLFQVGNDVYMIQKSDLPKGFWDIRQNTKSVCRSQEEIGHDHVDARIGLIPLEMLVSNGIALKIL